MPAKGGRGVEVLRRESTSPRLKLKPNFNPTHLLKVKRIPPPEPKSSLHPTFRRPRQYGGPPWARCPARRPRGEIYMRQTDKDTLTHHLHPSAHPIPPGHAPRKLEPSRLRKVYIVVWEKYEDTELLGGRAEMARLYVVGVEGSAGKVGTERALHRVQAKGKESAEAMPFAYSTAAARERERNARNAKALRGGLGGGVAYADGGARCNSGCTAGVGLGWHAEVAELAGDGTAGETHGRYTRNVRYNVYKQGGANERGDEGDDVRKKGESAGHAKQMHR
ncbi:hypothetical protein B0H13DRAFT_2456649 [Mycena leptocephala]|nr:hypothetical protein B0H13DRAFT_2456649 [Mycena leptocephala]